MAAPLLVWLFGAGPCYDASVRRRFVLSAFRRNAANLAAAAALFLLCLILFWPLLGENQALYFGDIGLYFVPLLSFQKHALLQGRIPLWNPTLYCGLPFVGNPQSWPLYPSSFLLLFWDAPRVVGIIGALHVLLAAVGTFLFHRRRGRSVPAALLAAVCWGFGGALVSKLQFPNMVQAAAYLPWLLLTTENLRRAAACAQDRYQYARCAAAALVWGLALLAAHAQITLMSFYVVAAWIVFGTGRSRRQLRGRLRGRSAVRRCWPLLLALLISLLLGTLLAAAHWLPAAEVARWSARPSLTLAEANRFYLPAGDIGGVLLWPNFRGNPALGVFTGTGNFWERAAYIGVVPLLLAASSIGFLRRRRETRFWLIAAVLCLWMALGRSGGLYTISFYLLPGLNRFHDPARWLIPATFALAALAARGLDHLRALLPGRLRGRVWQSLFVGAVLVISAADVLCFSRTLNPTVSVSAYAEARRNPAVLRILPASGRVLHLNPRAAWRRDVSYRTYGLPGTERAQRANRFLRALTPNLPGWYGVEDAGGYEPVAPRIALEREQQLREAALRLGNDIQNNQNNENDRALLQTAQVTTLLSLENARALPEAPKAAASAVPGEYEIPLPAGHVPQTITVPQTALPPWQVYVDGSLSGWQVTRLGFLSVRVGTRAELVQLSYLPNAWRLGLFLCLIAVGSLVAVRVGTWPRRSGFAETARGIPDQERTRNGTTAN